jgi:hypothetical protein
MHVADCMIVSWQRSRNRPHGRAATARYLKPQYGVGFSEKARFAKKDSAGESPVGGGQAAEPAGDATEPEDDEDDGRQQSLRTMQQNLRTTALG